MPGRLVDLHQHFPDVVDVAASLTEENGISALINLWRVVTCQLGRDEWRDFLSTRVTELIIVTFSWLGRALGRGLDVINVVDLIHEKPFGFDDDRDRLKRRHVFQPHRYRPGNSITHNHVDLGLAGEQSEHLADVVPLKFPYANTTALNRCVGFGQRRSRHRGRGRGRFCGRCRGWRGSLDQGLRQQHLRMVSWFDWVGWLSWAGRRGICLPLGQGKDAQ